MRGARTAVWCVLSVWALTGCKKDATGSSAAAPAAAVQKKLTIGLVTDVGGRGDHSFNDSALRGLELWAASARFSQGHYMPMTASDRASSLPPELASSLPALEGVAPVVVQSKAQEDYQPNLQLLVDQGAGLAIGVGFMLENAVESAAKANPKTSFLLIDSPILDAQGAPRQLPNVRTVVFREEEGSFLAGALAGLVAKEKVGFVGGMQIPLIRKFEAGFRAGVKTTNPKATMVVQYTGSFDNVTAGKQVGQDLVAKGTEVLFHAAGSDGQGVIQAVSEARSSGKVVYVIGVDSDQSSLAPNAVLTSMVKRVDLAVYRAVSDFVAGRFSSGDVAMGLKEGGVTLAEVKLPLEGKEAKLATVEKLKAAVVAGQLKVPSNLEALETFAAPTLE